MTLQELYYKIAPIVADFAVESETSQNPNIHAASAVICYFMGALQEANEEKKFSTLINMAMLIGLNNDELRKM